MNLLLTIIVLLCTGRECHAQFKSAMIGVNGLTCSACTRSVEMSIRKLNFVKDVEMNLENTEGKITFRDSMDVDIDKVAKAVTNAGFSVRYLNAAYFFNQVEVSDKYCYKDGKNQFQFMNTGKRALDGEVTLRFIGNEFLPKSEFNKFKPLPEITCDKSGSPVYFVTL